jgi:hypothetical protein
MRRPEVTLTAILAELKPDNRASVEELWGLISSDLDRVASVHREFTWHGASHALRVLDNAVRITKRFVEPGLTPLERRMLAGAALLHDYGMSCDAETLAPLVPSAVTARQRVESRAHHHLTISKLIETWRYDGLKNSPGARIFDALGDCYGHVSLVARAHADGDWPRLTEGTWYYNAKDGTRDKLPDYPHTKRLHLLAAILRLADLLDLLDRGGQQAKAGLSPDSYVHWIAQDTVRGVDIDSDGFDSVGLAEGSVREFEEGRILVRRAFPENLSEFLDWAFFKEYVLRWGGDHDLLAAFHSAAHHYAGIGIVKLPDLPGFHGVDFERVRASWLFKRWMVWRLGEHSGQTGDVAITPELIDLIDTCALPDDYGRLHQLDHGVHVVSGEDGAGKTLLGLRILYDRFCEAIRNRQSTTHLAYFRADKDVRPLPERLLSSGSVTVIECADRFILTRVVDLVAGRDSKGLFFLLTSVTRPENKRIAEVWRLDLGP